MTHIVSYAQNREDLILDAFFYDKQTGFYVDIGAFDPEYHSVTKYFYDKGWHGINIEPNSKYYKMLVAKRERDTNLNIAIADQEGRAQFREYLGAEGLSTLSGSQKKENKSRSDTKQYKDYEVAISPLSLVFEEQKVSTIDFMKIDTEGTEYDVLKSNDWSKYRPKVLCVEANKLDYEWKVYLAKQQYREVFNDGLNQYFVDEKAKDVSFNYEDAVIGRTYVSADTEKELLRSSSKLRQAEDELSRARNELRENEDEIARLHGYIYEKARFKNLAKDLILKVDAVIMLRLSKKIKAKKRYPAVDVGEKGNIADLLREVKTTDLKVFASKPSVFARLEVIFFKSVLAIYRTAKKIGITPLKYVRRQLKKKRGQHA